MRWRRATAFPYDPQPWHLDDAAAAANPVFGKLSASGWHTTVILSKLMDEFWKATSVRGLAGGGVDGVRWLTPVFVNDQLNGELVIASKRISATRPERGIMSMRSTLANQDGVTVIEATLTGVFARNGPLG